MGIKTKGAHCNTCDKSVMAQSNKPNHLLHFIISVFTAGLWIIPWIIITFAGIGGYRCTSCGQKVA